MPTCVNGSPRSCARRLRAGLAAAACALSLTACGGKSSEAEPACSRDAEGHAECAEAHGPLWYCGAGNRCTRASGCEALSCCVPGAGGDDWCRSNFGACSTCAGERCTMCAGDAGPAPGECVSHSPGCGEPALPEAGCYVPCSGSGACEAGEECREVSVLPDCVDEGCEACGTGVSLCLAAIDGG